MKRYNFAIIINAILNNIIIYKMFKIKMYNAYQHFFSMAI